MSEHTDVVVIGGGYSGVMAANRLTQRGDVTVTLINPRPRFVERIRLHQLVCGSDDAFVDYRDILAPGSLSWGWSKDDKRPLLLQAKHEDGASL